MNFKQSFILALKSLSASKMRSFLTMLGIIIGVASVIVLVSVVNGMKQEMLSTFESMGTNLITVTVRGRGSQRAVKPVDMIEFAMENPDLLAGCSPNVTTSATVKVDSENVQTSLLGVSEDFDEIRNLEVTDGRFLEYIDVDRKQKVCVVGSFIVKELYNGMSPVGNTIKIGNEVYRVVGVLEETAGGTEESTDNRVIIPYTSAARMAYTSSYLFSAADENVVDRAVRLIENYLYKVFANTNAYSVSSMDEMIDTVDDLTGKLTIMLVGIAGIALLVGGIGIMNIMLVSVTERTREIGIRKSLGAMQRDIMSQFVVEAATTSAIGGIVGIVLGIALAIGMGKIMDIAVYPSFNAVVIAFSVSAIIGITFGYFPARKAARLNPIDALRYD
jgi:putative ABC transport system permease protein